VNDLAIVIGVILFPGIIATIIADKIIVHSKPWTSLKYSIYSFVLGVSCYLLLQAVGWGMQLLSNVGCLSFLAGLPLVGKLAVWDIISDSKTHINLMEVFLSAVLSVPIAFLTSAIIYKKWINKVAAFFCVSSKYGDENLFSYFLNSNDVNWVYVRDHERKLTYQGRIFAFSEDSKVQEVVLSDVTVFGYESSDEYYSVPIIYLCRTQGSLIIEAIPLEFLKETVYEEETIK